MFTPDIKAMLLAQKLCFAATVSPDGKPAVSPKGVRILDETTLYLCDMNSPNTVRNLENNPAIELNVIDGFSRRGYRFRGIASVHREDEVFRSLRDRVHQEGIPYRINSIILVKVTEVSELVSPLYDFVTNEWEMRSMYYKLRSEQDKVFERHIRSVGPRSGNKAEAVSSSWKK